MEAQIVYIITLYDIPYLTINGPDDTLAKKILARLPPEGKPHIFHCDVIKNYDDYAKWYDADGNPLPLIAYTKE